MSLPGIQTLSASIHMQARKPAPRMQRSRLHDFPVNSLDAFVQMRSGIRPQETTGDAVFWAADGELYETPSGKLVARLEGVESSRAVRLENDMVRIFSRKLVWFLDPDTNEIMEEYQGQSVNPIRFDAQVFDVQQKQGASGKNDNNMNENSPLLLAIQPFVVRSTRLVPCMPITPRFGGSSDILMFQVPLFIDIEIPVDDQTTRKYQAWEFYDYCLDLSDDKKDDNPDKAPVLSWTRQGSTPPFCMDGNGVMHARGHRVETFKELPQSTQNYVLKNFPLFQGPPSDMEEVDELLGDGNK